MKVRHYGRIKQDKIKVPKYKNLKKRKIRCTQGDRKRKTG